jgi:hypothetical protein
VNGRGRSPSATVPVEATIGGESIICLGPNGPPMSLGSTVHMHNQM